MKNNVFNINLEKALMKKLLALIIALGGIASCLANLNPLCGWAVSDSLATFRKCGML